VRAPFDSETKGRNLVLKREMSQRALDGKLPKEAVKSDKVQAGSLAMKPTRRSFFRTWVRAVKLQPADTTSMPREMATVSTGSGAKPTGSEGKSGPGQQPLLKTVGQ